jgi:two-component sensor histidine kinase
MMQCGVQVYTTKFTHTDQQSRDVLFNKATFNDPDGSIAGFIGVMIDITDIKRAEAALVESLHEKELLLKEIHHRVKNNLQTIASLLYLQSLSTDDEGIKMLLNEARSRVYAMGLIHQKLYQSADITRIPFTDYIGQLIEFLKESYGIDETKIQISVSVNPKDLFLDLDTGIPCGLIINELVMNALKYAFRNRPGGTIMIQMTRDEPGENVLSVSDDGLGLSKDLDLSSMKSLGMTIVASLVRQLGGTLEIVRQPGTTITIRFPTQSPHIHEPPVSAEKPAADKELSIDEKIKRIRASHD